MKEGITERGRFRCNSAKRTSMPEASCPECGDVFYAGLREVAHSSDCSRPDNSIYAITLGPETPSMIRRMGWGSWGGAHTNDLE